MVGERKAPKVGAQGFGLHVTSAEDVLASLLSCPVARNPRKNDEVLIRNLEFLGTSELCRVVDVEHFMSAEALGLTDKSESWWVESHGRWCPHYVYYNDFFYDYYYDDYYYNYGYDYYYNYDYYD